MYEFLYDYVKPKYGVKLKLCYLDTDSFIVHIRTEDIYKDIAEDVETRFDTSHYELECNSTDRPLPKGKNKKVIGLMKDVLGEKIMIKFVGLRAKTYSYLIDDGSVDKKEKGTNGCVIKRKLKFENYKSCLEATQLDNKMKYLVKNKSILRTQQRFKSEIRNIFTEEIDKIALSSNDDKKMQPFDSIETYAY